MHATFTFLGELNDFLPHYQKNTSFGLEFEPHQSLKHLVESLGIPHTEYGQVLVNGQPAGPSSRLADGDLVAIHPARDPLEGDPHFLLDNHLGQLATYLRMFGFDCLYRNDYQDDELACVAVEQDRVLLTRDRRLLMRKGIRHGYCIHQTDPTLQAAEVLRRFSLAGKIKPFQRCLKCNTPLQVVDKQEILDRLEPLTIRYYDDFCICPSCRQIYWKGSHYEHMQRQIIELAGQG